ncbi:helix-turn-helix transcriptional regulator [Nesterenkonia sp.]|uniref:helix-turn-helix domain-containing protein n=1 Tax=Nesterenkonia sp. TaxID=704201 RepID=UPI00261888C7|nr:helix-turn-helix transcriptional regulator [Nesterenkonia sp.]
MKFRNLTVSPEDPVDQWGVEGILTAIDRGGLEHWQRIASAVRKEPYGEAAADLEEALELAEDSGVVALLSRSLQDARASERERFSQRFRALVDDFNGTHEDVARLVGTSRSRVSSYCSGSVVPSAAVLAALEDAVARRRADLL